MVVETRCGLVRLNCIYIRWRARCGLCGIRSSVGLSGGREFNLCFVGETENAVFGGTSLERAFLYLYLNSVRWEVRWVEWNVCVDVLCFVDFVWAVCVRVQ